MDGDPTVEPELDSFSLVLPLPFRVSLMIVLGVWAWGVNLHCLYLLDIDVPSLIKYPSRSSSAHLPHHQSTYRLATILTIPWTLSLLLFWVMTQGNPSSVVQWEIMPNFYLLILIICFIAPFHAASRSGRFRFLGTLRRISIGGLAEAQDGKFGDILMADALTSYAKVLGDLFVSLCMFFSSKHSSTDNPNRDCGGRYIVPFLIAVPYLIRLRQCLIEYFRVRKSNLMSGSIGSSGWGGQHLANALKYSSAFPVIIVSAMQSDYQSESSGNSGVFRLWLFFVFLNSFYSFYWDVAKDWDLTLFSPSYERDNPEYPYGLRRSRYFQPNEIYYGVIVVDLLLRFTWSFKLSPHLSRFNDLEGGIFLLEAMEVFRRWLWIFFRVEAEWIRTNRGPAPDDILLGDYNGKFDED